MTPFSHPGNKVFRFISKLPQPIPLPINIIRNSKNLAFNDTETWVVSVSLIGLIKMPSHDVFLGINLLRRNKVKNLL